MKYLSIIFLFISINNFAQEYIFKNTCYLGDDIHTQSIDTIKSKEKLNLLFYNKHYDSYTPSLFPNHLVSKKKEIRPLVNKTKDGYIVEYYDQNNRLIKYSFNNQASNFDVEIIYYNNNYPEFIIEHFLDLHHSDNYIASITYDLKYNQRQELIFIKMIDNNKYRCELEKIN